MPRIVQQDIPETKIGLLDLLKIYPVKNTSQFEEVIGILEPIHQDYILLLLHRKHTVEKCIYSCQRFFQCQ